MATTGRRLSVRKPNGYLAIFYGGLIAGLLDIASAGVEQAMHGNSETTMLQGIAFGLIGPRAFHGGLGTAAVGLVCHFVIAFGAAATYYFVSRGLPVLVRHAAICGLLYGIPVYIVTNYVVIPLSRIGRIIPHQTSEIVLGVIILMLCVGLPIGLATRRYS
jgi:hypothetical protein